ncbi:MAG: RnfABCDGE type electron transport complex subunit D [Bacilli bacterium]|nr:RnfABCDGE type electron transport complex subunit D [Bacilli bacterium]
MMTIVKETAPHLRRKATVSRMMTDVLIALGPTLIFSFVVYPLNTLWTLLISLFIMNASEFVYVGLRNMMSNDGQKHTFKERFEYSYKGKITKNNFLSASISAVIFTLIMPAGAPIYAVIIGSLVGIIFGKLVFGGLGSNIFNPAVVGMLFAKFCFGSQYVTYVPTWYFTIPDVASGATPLGLLSEGAFSNITQYPLLDLFLGRIPGTLGEVYKITIIIGLIYLLIRRSIDYRIVVSYLGTFVILMLIAGLSIFGLNNNVNPFEFLAYNLLSGGLLFGATFMLTDPVTSPINPPSRYLYGMIAAVITVFIRLFAALPEGVGYSILLANMVACVLDHYEWSSPRYTWKKFLAMGLIIIISGLVTFLAIYVGGAYHG